MGQKEPGAAGNVVKRHVNFKGTMQNAPVVTVNAAERFTAQPFINTAFAAALRKRGPGC